MSAPQYDSKGHALYVHDRVELTDSTDEAGVIVNLATRATVRMDDGRELVIDYRDLIGPLS